MNVREALQRADAAGVSRQESVWLLAAASGSPSSIAFSRPATELPAPEAARFAQLVRRRAAGEPLAYLLGSQPFLDLELEVTPAVLIPRPETELLVEMALDLNLPAQATVADLGTGSGAIAIAVARNRPGWTLIASDRSPAALAVAARNVARWAPGRVQLVAAAWLDAMAAACFDLLIANPPYVAVDDPDLAADVARFEPSAALFAGADGLDDLRALTASARGPLRPGGWLLLEHGHRQGAAVRDLMVAAGFTDVRSRSDAGDRERATLGRRGL